MNHARLYDIMSGKARGPAAAATRLGLAILEPGYHLGVAVRNRQFDSGKRKPAKLPRPVISVGNITTGGTGKTPMVIELARRLIDQGQKPAVLMRGYMKDRAASGQSDEAAELQHELGPAVPVMPNPDRVEAAKRVLDQHPDTTVFLLDDGFQHRQVHRDLNIVLIDALRPFGFGRLLPRGLLREPAQNLRRADAVIVTRGDMVAPQTIAEIDRRIESLAGQHPIAHTAGHWSAFRTAKMVSGTFSPPKPPGPQGETVSDTVFPPDHLKNKQVAAACAIGNPAAFIRMLEAAAGRVLHVHAFDDHQAYTLNDIRRILTDARQHGADAIVVTEKDWVKWRPLLEASAEIPDAPPIIRPKLGVRFLDGADKLMTAIRV